jgi:hypothetical protein
MGITFKVDPVAKFANTHNYSRFSHLSNKIRRADIV